MKKWWIFLKERFDPFIHTPLIVCYFFSNFYLAFFLHNQAGNQSLSFETVATFIIVYMMFLHLRLFDEIKDCETDKNIHPERPLARGLINISEFKRVTFGVISAECLIVYMFLPGKVFCNALVMIGYSLLMYKEFFVGHWLRPKMELYAITHTFVSSLMALFIFSLINTKLFYEMDYTFYLPALSNWMIFNVFEFARKTFGADEERTEVESYSKRLGRFFSVLIVFIFMTISLIAIRLATNKLQNGIYFFIFNFFLTLIIIFSSLPYIFTGKTKWAKLYRGAATSYLLLFNLGIIITLT